MISYWQQLQQRVNIYNIKNSDLKHFSFRNNKENGYYTEMKGQYN